MGGIDEAGRGSVVGPLVIAGVSFQQNKIELLKKIGVLDSKKITSNLRKLLFEKIIEICDSVYICKIIPKTIDEYVLQKKLNILEAKFMTIISDNICADKIIVDSCDVKPERFKQAILRNMVNKKIKIYAFHKADTDNIMVSAASILAKVTRDKEIEKIERILTKRIGSGYPSDPRTKLFLRENIFNINCKNYIRHSWYPVKQLIELNIQQKLIFD